METGLLDDEDSEEAKIGTLLHQYDANPFLDRSFLSQRNRELLRIAEICDEKIFARVREQFSISDNQPWVESTKGETWTVADTPGHTDRWRSYMEKGVLVVIDKKFGFKEVTPATSNYQLRVYACAGWEQLSGDLKSVVVAITQPRLPYEQRITMAHYADSDIAAAREEIVAIREYTREPDAPLIPGEEQCRYCKAKLICPAFQKAMGDGYQLVPAAVGTVTKRKADAQEILARCSDEDLDRMIQFVRFAEFVKEMAINEGRTRVEAGKLPQYELGKPSSPRYIDDPAKAEAVLILRGLLAKRQIWDSSSMSLGKIEEAVAEGSKVTLKEARKLVEDALADAIQREERKPSLIRKK